MLNARALRGHVPRFRRLAFLCTGSRMAADCAVAMAIARLPCDETHRPYAHTLPEVYRLLHEAVMQVMPKQDGALPPLHQRLLALDLPQRALLLLVVVEGLALAEAAAICDLPEEAAADLLAAAREGLEGRFAAVASR